MFTFDVKVRRKKRETGRKTAGRETDKKKRRMQNSLNSPQTSVQSK